LPLANLILASLTPIGEHIAMRLISSIAFAAVAVVASTSYVRAALAVDDVAAVAQAARSGPSDSDKALVRCQIGVARAGQALLDGRLKRLSKCALGVLACVQTNSADGECLPKIGAKCLTLLTEDDQPARKKFAARIVKTCTSPALGYADILSPEGLDLGTLVSACPEDAVGACPDLGQLARCVGRQHERAADRLFSFQLPRAAELLGLVDIELLNLPEFEGCEGCSQTPTKTGKRILSCGSTVVSAARSVATDALKALDGCIARAFACDQGSDTVDCRAKAEKACVKAAEQLSESRVKLFDQSAALVGKNIGKKCRSLVDQATSRQGLNLTEPLAVSCQQPGLPAADDLVRYAACVERQHACEVADLIARVLPRAAHLLDAGRIEAIKAALGTDNCPNDPPPLPKHRALGAREARTLTPFSIQKFLTLVKRPGGFDASLKNKAAPASTTNVPKAVNILSGPTRVRFPFGAITKLRLSYRSTSSLIVNGADASRSLQAVGNPKLVVTIQRPDIQLTGWVA
jgi:hypothetical protein